MDRSDPHELRYHPDRLLSSPVPLPRTEMTGRCHGPWHRPLKDASIGAKRHLDGKMAGPPTTMVAAIDEARARCRRGEGVFPPPAVGDAAWVAASARSCTHPTNNRTTPQPQGQAHPETAPRSLPHGRNPVREGRQARRRSGQERRDPLEEPLDLFTVLPEPPAVAHQTYEPHEAREHPAVTRETRGAMLGHRVSSESNG